MFMELSIQAGDKRTNTGYSIFLSCSDGRRKLITVLHHK